MSKEQLLPRPKNISALEAEILALEQGGSVQPPVEELAPVEEKEQEVPVKEESLSKEEQT